MESAPMDTDSLCPSPPRSEPNEVDIPHEQIRRTMTVMLNVFAVHPVDAYHPGRHIALRDAVPVLSALNRSHGLTDDQVEGLGNLLNNWDRIINDAVEAGTAKKAATQELLSCYEVALTVQTAQSKMQILVEETEKAEEAWPHIPRFGADVRREHELQLQKEMEVIVSEMKKLTESLPDAKPMDPTLEQQIEEAEESLEKANQEWKALEMLLRGINSSLPL